LPQLQQQRNLYDRHRPYQRCLQSSYLEPEGQERAVEEVEGSLCALEKGNVGAEAVGYYQKMDGFEVVQMKDETGRTKDVKKEDFY